MGISNLVATVTVFVTGLMPMSCHKAAQTKAPPAAATTVTNSIRHNLGEVALTNHYETCVVLGGGKQCTFRPRMLDAHTVEITFALESKTNAGKIHDLTVTQATTKSGKPLEVAIGDFQLSLTPRMVLE